MGSSFNIKTDFMGDYITARTAAEMSGCNQQYLRRLLRGNILISKRLGQLWLIVTCLPKTSPESMLGLVHPGGREDGKTQTLFTGTDHHQVA